MCAYDFLSVFIGLRMTSSLENVNAPWTGQPTAKAGNISQSVVKLSHIELAAYMGIRPEMDHCQITNPHHIFSSKKKGFLLP